MTAGSHASAFADGDAYEATLGPAHRYYIRVKARLLRRVVARHGPSSRRFVDLGCGTGEMAQGLVGSGFEITGVDLSPAMIEHAKSKRIPGATFRAADATRTGLPSQAFDVAFATALFHHVPANAHGHVAREMNRVLRPGGLGVIFEHNPANPITRRIVRHCPVDEGVTLLPRHAAASILEAAGLTVIDHRYLLFFPRSLGALSPLERFLSWVPFGGQYVVVGRKDGSALKTEQTEP